MKVVEGIDRVPTCLINKDGKYYALSGICTHKGGCLWEGELRNEHIVCPFHMARFRLSDGKNSWPAPRAVRSFLAKVVDDSIFIGVEK
jgi:nitrite reductase/ring-hydroxylating ferredoxin subunit